MSAGVNTELITALTSAEAENVAGFIVDRVRILAEKYRWTADVAIAVADLAIEVHSNTVKNSEESLRMLFADIEMRAKL